MRTPTAVLSRLVVVAFFSFNCVPSWAADIRVYSGGAPQTPLQALAPAFEQRTGHKVIFTFALVTDIQEKLAAGEKADVVLLPVPLLAATEKKIPLQREGRVTLARVGIALIVRDGAPAPDISSPERFRQLLVDSRSISLPEPSTPSGAHLARVIKELGIEDAVRPKAHIRAAIKGGAELVATGEAEVGMYLLSEVQSTKGIRVVGLLPTPVQSFVTYGAAIPAYNNQPDASLAFIRFISDPANGDEWRRGGFELSTAEHSPK